MFAVLGSWWPPKWVQADWVLRAAWWISGDTATAGTRCDEFHDPGTALLLLYQAPVVENTLLNLVARSGCFATHKFNPPPPPPPPPGSTQQTLNGEASPRGPNPYPFIYHFWQEMYPFPAHTSWQMVPSHVPNLNPSASRFRSFHKPQWQISPTFHTDFDDKFYADLLAITEVLR